MTGGVVMGSDEVAALVGRCVELVAAVQTSVRGGTVSSPPVVVFPAGPADTAADVFSLVARALVGPVSFLHADGSAVTFPVGTSVPLPVFPDVAVIARVSVSAATWSPAGFVATGLFAGALARATRPGR